MEETPDYIAWCRTCVCGVGIWGGVGDPSAPPRCPACRTSNFDPAVFAPLEAEEVKRAEVLADLHHLRHKVSVALENAREATAAPHTIDADLVNVLHALMDELTDIELVGADR